MIWPMSTRTQNVNPAMIEKVVTILTCFGIDPRLHQNNNKHNWITTHMLLMTKSMIGYSGVNSSSEDMVIENKLKKLKIFFSDDIQNLVQKGVTF